jgi:ATP-dependent RNA helicase DDX51/DBP6
VLPTQDLALQVFKVFSAYTEGSGLRVKLLTGGDSVAGEAGLVRHGLGGLTHQLIDILVVTPGRLVHTIRDCPKLDLSHLR